MALKSVPSKQFDDAKLDAMIEPLTVRVEKLTGGRRQPIPLPESEENPAGQGVNYDKAAVRQLEQFLVTEWSGGGYYEIKVTDSQNQVLTWSPSWEIALYPEKVPPPLQGSVNPNPIATKRTTMPAFPTGFPSFQQQQPQQGYGYPQQYGQQYAQPQGFYPPLPPPPPITHPAYGMWSNEAKERGESMELRALRDENARKEREAIEARHKAEIERDRIQNEQRFNAQNQSMTELRNMITSLTTAIQAGAQQQQLQANNKPDDKLEVLRMQLEAQKQAAADAARDRENDRRERETRDLIKGMQDSAEKQLAAMTRQLEAFQQSLTAINSTRQDPMIEMLKEQSRQSAEMVKTIATSHSTAIDKMQSNMMHPRDILAVAREASTQADQVTDKLTTSFGRVIDLQAKVTENALQLQPQGSPIVDMIRDGAAHAKEMAERYLGRAELQAKLQAAAQENLLTAQRDIQIAQINATNPGLAGHQYQQQIEQPVVVVQNGQAAKPAKGKKAKPVVDVNGQPVKPKKHLGKTDHEWFMQIEEDINRLREGVSEYITSLSMDPVRTDKDGVIIGVSAEYAAQYIAQGTAMAVQMHVDIPAMTQLLFESRHADFMEVVLPDAPETYRVDVINVLIPLLRGEVGGGDGMTGVAKEDPTAEGEDEETESEDGDGDKNEAADDGPDDGDEATDDAAHDGAKSAPRGAAVTPPVLRAIGQNGKPINPPRRA